MASERKFNVLIYGGGAVGSILGWRIAESGVALISIACRSNYERVRRSGYSFRTSRWGTGSLRPRLVYKIGSFEASNLVREKFDWIVCAQKITNQSDEAIRDLRQIVSPETTLVTAQNGMDVEKPLLKAFPDNRVYTAICNIGCSQLSPGVVEQTTGLQRNAFVIGSDRDITVPKALKQRIGQSSDFAFETPERVRQARWRKLIFNCAWNSTCALTGLDTHGLLSVPGAADMVLRLASEAYRVAGASGVVLESNLPERTVRLAAEVPTIVPSTLQDVRGGRVMELEPIFGYVVTQAMKVGVQVPCMEMVYSMLKQTNANLLQAARTRVPCEIAEGRVSGTFMQTLMATASATAP